MTESENCDSKYQKVVNHLIITQRLKGKDSKKQTNKKKNTNTKKDQKEKDYVIYKMLYRNSHGNHKAQMQHRQKTQKQETEKTQTWQTETQGKRNNGDLKQPENAKQNGSSKSSLINNHLNVNALNLPKTKGG